MNHLRMRTFHYLALLIACVWAGCQGESFSSSSSSQLVTNAEELATAIAEALPGDDIVMADGIWENVEIRFQANGTEKKPITLRAEHPGQVFIEGASDLKLAGQYLTVKGLYFRNGHSPSSAVIEFEIEDQGIANHCRITECVIEDYNQAQRNQTDLWVRFRGRHNQLDHCYLAGKSNRGPSIRVDLEGNQHIKNYHRIEYNHFGPRPPKGGPSAETIQIGNSSTSMVPSYTLTTYNLFDHCNGEVEVISSKSNFNEFRGNVFYQSEGSLVTRHGNYCILDGNYFIGDGGSKNIGGIRLIGTGHWVTNNYFYQLKGENFRSPLAVMNGIPKSPLNRYIQVTDVVVAYNSWINCESPWHFGVGANLDQKDVLPPSEIRSARPIRTTVANNVIYHESPQGSPLVAYDRIDQVDFQSNYLNNQVSDLPEGMTQKDFSLAELGEKLFRPTGTWTEEDLFEGFEFDQITDDLFGQSRVNAFLPGAIASTPSQAPNILDSQRYGPSWFDPQASEIEASPQTTSVEPENFISVLENADPGAVLSLAPGEYEITRPLVIDKLLFVQAADSSQPPTILYSGPAATPAFEMNPGGDLNLEHIILRGEDRQYAFASLKTGMSSLYNLKLVHCEVDGFDFILKAYKYSFSEFLTFSQCKFSNCRNGIELSEETEDKGEYNAENIRIEGCQFDQIGQNVVDYYRGGYDESTVGGNLEIVDSDFTRCGGQETNGILLNTYGIINVRLANNTFRNNPVKLVALLWGAKNNRHIDNTLVNSGEIRTEENLKLNLLY